MTLKMDMRWRSRAVLATALAAWSTDSAAHAVSIPGWIFGVFLIGACGVLACVVVPFLGEVTSPLRNLFAGIGLAMLDVVAWVALVFLFGAMSQRMFGNDATLVTFLALFPWILPIGFFFWGRRKL